MRHNETFTIAAADLERLAQELIEDCCIEGVRNAGGRYTKAWSHDGSRLRRLVAKRIGERLRDLCNKIVAVTQA